MQSEHQNPSAIASCNWNGASFTCTAPSLKLAEQGFCRSQVARGKTFGEPVVDRGEQVMGRAPAALVTEQPRQARRRAELPRPGLLRARNGQRMLEMRLRFRRVALRRGERDFAGNTMSLGLAPPFPGRL